MVLIRYRLLPESTWISRWQADTLTGLLLREFIHRHRRGVEQFESEIVPSFRRGDPPFVLSDGFPEDLLPTPACFNLWGWREDQRKLIKRTEWLSREEFQQVQAGLRPTPPATPRKPFRPIMRMRNTINRATDTTTGEADGSGGTLYAVPATGLAAGSSWLSVYARVKPEYEKILTELWSGLAQSGFGADAAVGQGHFRLSGPPEDAGWLDAAGIVGGIIVLSTYQPAASDPVSGYWNTFVKYGKLGPDVGARSVFKRPQLMFQPGACFRTNSEAKWCGRLIEPTELLDAGTANDLAAKCTYPVQAAFGLAVPFRWPPEIPV